VPPEPVTGVKAFAATFCVSTVVGTATVDTTAEFTAMLKFAVAVVPIASVTVTV
jgi:hypothetical protein